MVLHLLLSLDFGTESIMGSFFIRKEHEPIRIRGKTKVTVICRTFTLNQV